MKTCLARRAPFLLGATLLWCAAHAQAPSAAPAPAQLQTTKIQLKSAPARFVAYWLDPVHQSVPPEIQSSQYDSSRLANVGSIGRITQKIS